MIKSLPDKHKWSKYFVKSTKYKKLIDKINEFSEKNAVVSFDGENMKISTPRDDDFLRRRIDLQPFYILDYIRSNTNEEIYDIGCGSNWFKEIFNVIGIDPYNCNADINESYNDLFIQKNCNRFSNAVTINAIHFCSISKIENNVLGFINLVKPNGYCYIAINTARIMDETQNMQDKKDIMDVMNNIVKNINDTVILYENKINEHPDEYLNGNFRLLIKRTNR